MLVIVLGRQGDHSCEEAVGGRGGCAGLGPGAGAQAESGGAGRRAPPHTRGSRDPPARVGVVGEGFSRRGQGPRSGGPGVGTSASVQSRCSALSRSRCRARAPWGWRIRAPGSRLGSRCGLVPGGGACPLPASLDPRGRVFASSRGLSQRFMRVTRPLPFLQELCGRGLPAACVERPAAGSGPAPASAGLLLC